MQEPIPSNEWKNKMKEWVKDQLKTYNYEQIKQNLINYGYSPVIAVEIIEQIKYEISPFELLKEQIEKIKAEQETDRNVCYADIERLRNDLESFKKEIDSKFHANRRQINEVFLDINKRKLNVWKFRKQEPLLLGL